MYLDRRRVQIFVFVLTQSQVQSLRPAHWLACLLSGPVIFHSHQRVPLLLAAASIILGFVVRVSMKVKAVRISCSSVTRLDRPAAAEEELVGD